jgi:metacaspase-1
MASKRIALCVGINHFHNYPGSALQGCINDAHAMAALLRNVMGFAEREVAVLTDAQATKARIMSSLEAMIAGAKAGKYGYLVFSMSSHGTQVPDTSGDEPDRADEAFCPYDLAQTGYQWDLRHIILDDELHDLFVRLPPEVLLEAYLDTCHSGTGLKALDLLSDRKPRYMPPPSYEAFAQVDGRRSRGLHEALLENGKTHHVLWAACRPDQTSADAQIAGSWHGAFTYYFCKEVNACGNRLPRTEILKKVRHDLAAAHYTQIPQLECDATNRKAQAGLAAQVRATQ